MEPSIRAPSTSLPFFTWRDLVTICKEHACSPLVTRVITSHWQELVLIGGIVLAVASAAAAFFYGSYFLGLSFIALGALNATGAFYMHQFSALQDLEKTAHALKNETTRLSSVVDNLEKENRTLTQTNQDLIRTQARLKNIAIQGTSRDLSRTNSSLRRTNSALQITNGQLQQTNTQLTEQVTRLTIQISQLQESAERIRNEVQLFAQGNIQFDEHLRSLNASVRLIDDQIISSRQLCELIKNRLQTESQGLGEQIQALRVYFRELSDQHAITQRIQQFTDLQTQIHQATQELHRINLQYAEERARLVEIQNVLLALREAFTTLLTDIHIANIDHRAQNQLLQRNVDQLSVLISRIPPLAN